MSTPTTEAGRLAVHYHVLDSEDHAAEDGRGVTCTFPEAIAAIEAEAVNAALNKVAEAALRGKRAYHDETALSAVMDAIEAARPQP